MATAMLRINGKARALALALVITLAFAARAEALPVGFWGVVPQSTPTAEQFQRLGRGGVESVRISLDWGSLQPRKGGAITWAGIDEIVENATINGIEVLPVLTDAPPWAVPSARVPGAGGAKAPAHLPAQGAAAVAWKSFLTQAVERYGPNGAFWATHPKVPLRPVRLWQIWNEPNFKYFVARPNPVEYGKLVNLSSSAVRSADPGAKLILAGLFSQPRGARTPSGKHTGVNWFASDFLEKMYKSTPGIKAKFNGIALHPYTSDYRRLTPEIGEVRKVLRDAHDGRKGLWVTELGWSSKPPMRGDSFAKGPTGQVTQLKGAFNLLSKNQRLWNVRAVDWFSVDDLAGVCNFCDGTGLFAKGFVPKRSWYAYVKFTGGTP